MSAPTQDLCGCGCGAPVSKGARYVRGHWARSPEGRAVAAKGGRAAMSKARSVSEQANPEEVSEAPDEVEAIVSTGVDVSEAKAMVSGLTGEQQNGNVRIERTAGWSDDEVVTMLNFIGIDAHRISKMIDLMDFIGKIKRGEA